jgi:hypothetical protein
MRPLILAALRTNDFMFDRERKPAVFALDASRVQTVPRNGLFDCPALWNVSQGISLAQK